ncbi:MAG: sugar phosphate isomerase/epimerase [Alphaproteobacteria bacterium]
MNKFGVHALVWVGGWSEAESERAIAGTAELGYDLIEIPLLNPAKVDAARTRRQLEAHGLTATCSLGLAPDTDISGEDDAAVARGEALLNDALAVTRDIGAKYMGGVIYSALGKYNRPPTAKGRANCAGVLNRLAAKAKASGITLGLEAVNRYETNLLNTLAQAGEFIDEIGADNVVVHADTYHMNIEDGNLAKAVRDCGAKVGYVHIGESHRGYLGTGTIDFTAVFRALHEIGYGGSIVFESFSSAVVDPQLSTALAVWRNLWSDSRDLAAKAKAFMEAGWDSARRATNG